MEPKNHFAHLAPSSKALRQDWGWFLVLGVFLILSGIAAIFCAVFTTLFTIFILSIVLLAGGAANIIHAFWVRQWSGFFLSLLIGILYGLAGFLFMMSPLKVASALTLLIGSLFLVGGLFKACSSLVTRFEHWGWILFSGLISILFGVLVLSEWPAISLWMIGVFIGVDLLCIGWAWVIFSLAARAAQKNA